MRLGLILSILLGTAVAAGLVTTEDSLHGLVAAEDGLQEGKPRSAADDSLFGRVLDSWRSLRDDKIFFLNCIFSLYKAKQVKSQFFYRKKMELFVEKYLLSEKN
jgi:hypothetical protein